MNARGIDVSKWQEPSSLNWSVIAAEHAFVFARATYGTTTDKHFVAHVTGAQSAGMKVGGYHFFRQTQSVDEQIQAFFATLDDAGCGPGWLPPVIDVESNTFDGDLDPDKYRTGVRAMVDACRLRYGACIIYINPSDSAMLGDPDWFRDPDVLLWIAHHGAKIPRTPNGAIWSFWQTTDNGEIAGSSAPLDLNVFCGPAARLPLIKPEAETEHPTAPDTERPSPLDITEVLAVELSKLRDIEQHLADGFLDQSSRLTALENKLDRLIAMVGSENATLNDHHERLGRLEERFDEHVAANGAAHG